MLYILNSFPYVVVIVSQYILSFPALTLSMINLELRSWFVVGLSDGDLLRQRFITLLNSIEYIVLIGEY